MPRVRAGILAVLLLAAGVLLLGRAGWLEVKAVLAHRLIAHAFTAHIRDGAPHLPWSWADTHPIAELRVPRLGVNRYVLSGASGSSLAFGVGHVDGTALPNGTGNCVLAGHRDRQFAFLADLRLGDEITVTSHDRTAAWVVESVGVVNAGRTDLLESHTDDRLTLMTCYPFGGLVGTSRRYVVWCRPGSGSMRHASSAGRTTRVAVE